MKKFLVVLCIMCLGLTACGTVMKAPELVDESSAEPDVDFSVEDPDESLDTDFTVDESVESPAEDEAPRYTYKDYVNDMINLDNLSATTISDGQFDGFHVVSGNKAYDFYTTVDVTSMLETFLAGMGEDESNSNSQGTYTTYSGEVDGAGTDKYTTGRVELRYYPLNGDKWAQHLKVTVDGDKLHELYLDTMGYIGNAYDGDITVNGLNLNSTLQDFLDTFGLPTKAFGGDSGRKGTHYEVTYYWEDFMDGELSASFEVIKDYDTDTYDLVPLNLWYND